MKRSVTKRILVFLFFCVLVSMEGRAADKKVDKTPKEVVTINCGLIVHIKSGINSGYETDEFGEIVLNAEMATGINARDVIELKKTVTNSDGEDYPKLLENFNVKKRLYNFNYNGVHKNTNYKMRVTIPNNEELKNVFLATGMPKELVPDFSKTNIAKKSVILSVHNVMFENTDEFEISYVNDVRNEKPVYNLIFRCNY